MPRLAQSLNLIVLVAATGLAGCKKDAASTPGLVGTWQLISREGCYCPRGPVPNETFTLTATGFTFTKNGQLVGQGTYAESLAAKCGSSARIPVLGFTDVTNQTFRNVPFTFAGGKLVLDYSNRCVADSPIDTYQRLP